MSGPLRDRLATLSPVDRRLLLAMSGVALLVLLGGITGGVGVALARAGWIDLLPEAGYRLLTLHGVGIFFYWLFLVQAAILLALAAGEGGHGLAWRALGWAGFLLILTGMAFSLGASSGGTLLLYDGNPQLAANEPGRLAAFNAGYILLGLGLIAIPAAGVATLLAAVRRACEFSAVGFALFAWAGFLMVSGFAMVYVFLPGLLWALGLGGMPTSHGTNWHIVFHNMHYLPLMATVVVWYVLMQEVVGVKSVFGARFSKLVFAAYLVFVPPTSLYHMFLEPDLPGAVRIAGSLLSLFVSVPTLTAFLIIVASLEMHARARGGRGLFGWIRTLPWREPAMAAAGFAVVNMAFGLVLAFVLIQADLAPLLSDTFFVPGYFHFFTVGTVSLSFLAALALILPALTGRGLALPGVARFMPHLATLGLLAFGGAGVAAGYLGVPRRVIDAGYGGEAPALWATLMGGVAAGGLVMALALVVFALSVAASLLPGRAKAVAMSPRWDGIAPPRAGAAALVGPLGVLVIVIGMYGATATGFELMRALPVEAVGAGHGH
ncbi:cbb3-type cytochrome c oxidase subunit I [Roseovarius autotrophicus]|uniref:cbb3-type cytochrome c oxidase subunit I n=1 Tax=Roseovarius autotrophicus TaxID=2824121 RepID=UPI001B35FBB4|nr:cbb3-type cytochrome c oxidase subunit I [Roseovarius autotrophicus]